MRAKPIWFYKVQITQIYFDYSTGLRDTFDSYIPIVAHNKEEAYNKVLKKYSNRDTFVFNKVERISRTEFRKLKQKIAEG